MLPIAAKSMPDAIRLRYGCVRIDGRRKPSTGPFNLSHWPSLLHPCREQKSSAALTAPPSFVSHVDSLDALGREARHHQHRERGRPSNHAQQALGNPALCAWPYTKSSVAVQNGDVDLDFRDLPFEVPRHQRLDEYLYTMHLRFDAASALVSTPASP